MVTILEPLKEQLKVLRLDFRGYPDPVSGLAAFRPIPSLAGFTALKSLILGRLSIAPPVFDHAAARNKTDEEKDRLKKAFIENTKDFLVNFLPCGSLAFLQIDGIVEGLDHPMCELARRASLGGVPNLAHVRMRGKYEYALHQHKLGGYCQAGRYHDLQRFVPEKYRGRARVAQAGSHPMMETETRPLFRQAGVLFERLAVKWDVSAEKDSELSDGLMQVYAQPCVGVCGTPECDNLQEQTWRDTL